VLWDIGSADFCFFWWDIGSADFCFVWWDIGCAVFCFVWWDIGSADFSRSACRWVGFLYWFERFGLWSFVFLRRVVVCCDVSGERVPFVFVSSGSGTYQHLRETESVTLKMEAVYLPKRCRIDLMYGAGTQN
jgi:hypothetical protein